MATAAVCDEARSYRVIRVNNGNLQAENTVSAGNSGNYMRITYSTDNDGSDDNVNAVINNNHNLSFNNGIVKFIMPKCDSGYIAVNGQIEQIDNSGDYAICYVKVEIPLNNSITVNLKTATYVENDRIDR